MDCNSSDSSVHGILQARILEWVAIPFFQWIFPNQGSSLGLLHCRQIFTIWATQEVLVFPLALLNCPPLLISHPYSAVAAATAAKSLQLRPTLCDPIDGSPPGSPVPGILQARTLEWVAISLSNAWKWKVKSESEVTQSCPTLSYPMDCRLPGSSVHGIFQARVLEWGAIAFSC